MNTKTSLKLALGTTFAAGMALGSAQAIADNPFAASTLESGYMQLAASHKEGNCGGKKSGEGKCKADTDGDGTVTKEEFMQHHEDMFNNADADGDGVLNADEQKNLHKGKREGKCGGKEGKCGEGKCGGNKSDDSDKS